MTAHLILAPPTTKQKSANKTNYYSHTKAHYATIQQKQLRIYTNTTKPKLKTTLLQNTNTLDIAWRKDDEALAYTEGNCIGIAIISGAGKNNKVHWTYINKSHIQRRNAKVDGEEQIVSRCILEEISQTVLYASPVK